jgi:hypothetical protein
MAYLVTRTPLSWQIRRMNPVPSEFEAPHSRRVPPLPRVDLYGAVHRGLRLAHTKLLVQLGTTSYGDRAAVEATLDELEGFLELAELHLRAEERHYHPALEARRPQAAARLEEQHRNHAQAFAELRGLAAKLSAATRESVNAVGRALYLRYTSFMGEDLAHMAEEELVSLPLFHELYGDAELVAIQERLVAEIPPEERLAFMRLMIPASNHEERLAQLGGLKAAVPPPAFAALLDALQPTLPEGDFARLRAAL